MAIEGASKTSLEPSCNANEGVETNSQLRRYFLYSYASKAIDGLREYLECMR